MNFPLPEFIAVSAANPWTYVLFGVIGFAFGFTLEMSGFGDSRKLAAQFYFTELTVLKVMFTAIVTALVQLFGCGRGQGARGLPDALWGLHALLPTSQGQRSCIMQARFCGRCRRTPTFQ